MQTKHNRHTPISVSAPVLTHGVLQASVVTGDRVWRMPLFQHYTRQVTDCQLADLNNIGKYSRYVSHHTQLAPAAPAGGLRGSEESIHGFI